MSYSSGRSKWRCHQRNKYGNDTENYLCCSYVNECVKDLNISPSIHWNKDNEELPPTRHPALPKGRELNQVLRYQPNGTPVLDLHGMRRRQALEWMNYCFRQCGHGLTRIITGRGLHSPGGKPVLREAAMDYLKKKGYQFSFVRDNTGFLEVRPGRNWVW